MRGEVNLRSALEKSGVIVEKLPKGMTRAKENQTAWSKGPKCVSWTVEWVEEDGKRALGRCLENTTLENAWTAFAKPQEASKKRKRGNAVSPAEKNEDSLADGAKNLGEQPDAEEPRPRRWFYLSIPHTPSNPRVLAHVQSDQPLGDALRDRVVIEFPTLHALEHPPEQLPRGYILENDYLDQHKKENGEIDEFENLRNLPTWQPEGGEAERIRQDIEKVDEKNVLDVLRKDVFT